MAVYSFRKVQIIPAALDSVWSFFADPSKLPLITPPDMGFRVISLYHGDRIYAGQIIEYRLRPVAGIRVYWMTEITQVKEGAYFIDQQRIGPYRLWHHQHHFKEVPAGVEMTDIVHYSIPWGPIGDFANWLFVRRRLEGIFRYRRQQVEEIFGCAAQ